MPADLTNLLPPERKRALTRGYFMRLAAIGLFVASFVVVAHGILLVPSYIYIAQQIGIREDQLASFTATAGTLEDQETNARITLLKANANRLLAESARPTASVAFRDVLAAPRTGISIVGITYGPSAAPEQRKITVKGIAANREVLRNYVKEVEALPTINTTELPISAYAKESDIDFVLSLTGTFKP